MTRPLPVFLPPLPLLNGMIFMGDVPHSFLCPLHSMAAPLAWSTLLGSGSAVDPARFRLLLWGAEPLIRLGLQPDSLSALPMAGFNPGQIETMMGVFNQHYDVLPPSDREKLLHWVKHCVAMEMFNCSIGQPMGNRGKSEKDPRVKCPPRLRWLKAHTMAVLGRFLSLVPPSELEDIESDEVDPQVKCPPRLRWLKAHTMAVLGRFLSLVPPSELEDIQSDEMQRDVNASALLQSLAGSLVGSLALHTLQQASVDSVGVIQGKSWNRGQMQRDVNASALLQSLAGSLVGSLALHTLQQASVDSVGVIQGKSWNRGQGVTCDLIDSIGDQNMLETAAVLSENKAWLSQHQLACSAKKLWAALNRTRADYFGSMNNSELQDVPPVFLLHLTSKPQSDGFVFPSALFWVRSQLACSAKKLWAALNRTRADYFGSMNNSELQDVPPVFLLHLT
ncbi:UNVERIFIED_CONTAM: hypothetical protein FKN15_018169 [Acipenser sinensis]